MNKIQICRQKFCSTEANNDCSLVYEIIDTFKDINTAVMFLEMYQVKLAGETIFLLIE